MMSTQENLFQRPHYQALLAEYLDTEPIKVVRGIRRSGKSTLLKLFIGDLAEQGVASNNIFFKRFDQFGLPLNQTAEDLVQELGDAIGQSDPEHMFYVFLDEIQDIDGWERVVRGLHTRSNTDVYITGSNAFLLSSDLATLLSGRYVTIDVFPLSFQEYLNFKTATGSSADNLDVAFSEYLRYGGMPSLFALKKPDDESTARELSALYDTVILNDVARRFSIRDFALLEKLVQYVFSTSGNLFSMRSIVNTLTSAGRKTSFETVENYLNALEHAFILYGPAQTGLQGKRILRPLKKYYPADTGLRNLSTGFSLQNFGFQIENVVFVELLRRGYHVEVGATDQGEVDFVAIKHDDRLYVQVTESMVDETVYRRELKPLETLRDSFPKIVLTLDHLRTGTTDEGIRIINTIDWLLQEKATGLT